MQYATITCVTTGKSITYYDLTQNKFITKPSEKVSTTLPVGGSFLVRATAVHESDSDIIDVTSVHSYSSTMLDELWYCVVKSAGTAIITIYTGDAPKD